MLLVQLTISSFPLVDLPYCATLYLLFSTCGFALGDGLDDPKGLFTFRHLSLNFVAFCGFDVDCFVAWILLPLVVPLVVF
jgi:hypothetical protein